MDSTSSFVDTIFVKNQNVTIDVSNTVFNGHEYLLVAAICLAVAAGMWILHAVCKFSNFQTRFVSSDKLGRQIIGAVLEWNSAAFWTFVILVIPLSTGISYIIKPYDTYSSLYLVCLNFFVWLAIKTCRRLLDIFSLRKKDTAITWCYITVLLALWIWLVSFLLIFNTREDGRVATAVAVIGAIVSLVFQDKIKGAAAFFHLRIHHFLNIGDWIQVLSKDVDGEVQKITLTSVKISNWDTTTSIIPISMLHVDHFKNLQNMMEGKTYGRRMLMTFIFDINWFCSLSKELVRRIEKDRNINLYLSDGIIGNGILNAKVYRQYLYHWLMNNAHVSQQPRLMVRWLEQKESGMPLQIYAFITDSSLAAFEWQQSQIIEHIIESAGWFNMRLFQAASAFDVSNSNIYLTKEPALYRKEDLQ